MALSASITAPLLTQTMLEKRNCILYIRTNQNKNLQLPRENNPVLYKPFDVYVYTCIFADCISVKFSWLYKMSFSVIFGYLTNSTEHSSSWEADNQSTSQETLCLLQI
jgi:hypothetical protein